MEQNIKEHTLGSFEPALGYRNARLPRLPNMLGYFRFAKTGSNPGMGHVYPYTWAVQIRIDR